MAIIKLKRSNTPGKTPASLEHGEVAINISDKKIYIGSGDTNDTAVLIVDGNASRVSTETIQDAAASLFTSGTHTGISVSYPDTNNAINLVNTGVLSFNTRIGAISLTSSDVTTALGFTPISGVSTETIQDAAASLFTTGTHTGISVSYPDTNNSINLVNTGVLSFNTRTGAVSLTSSDVTTALGYTPQRQEPTLTAIANLSPDADDLIYFSGTDGAAITTLTSFGRSLIDDINASTARTTLGLAIGTNVQAWDADLDSIAALSGTSGFLKKTAANTWLLDTATFVTLTGVETLTNKTLTSPTISNLYLSDGLILVEGTTNDSNEMSLVVGTLTADRTITFPNATGTVVTTGNLTSITSTGTLGATSISGALSVINITLYSGTELFINNDGNVRTIIGDLGGNGNTTYIDIDDASGKITLNAVNGIDNGGSFLNLVSAPSFADTYSFCRTYRTTTTATTANQTIATFAAVYDDGEIPPVMNYPAFEVTISARDTITNKTEMVKMLVVHDGTNTVNTQYGLIRTGATSLVSSYSTTLTGTPKNLLIRATPVSANSTNFTTTIHAHNA